MEKERLEKVRRIIFLETELWFFKHNRPERRDVDIDWGEIRAGDEFELTKLYLELYPYAPKDLMEDVKKRMEAYKRAKIWREDFISLSFRQKIKNLFRRKKEV